MGETIQLTASDGHDLAAYRATPAGERRGGLVVIQEIFGVNVHIRAVADGFAADGYEVVAPALFDRAERGVELGYDEAGVARGRGLRGEISWDEVVLDVEVSRAALASAGAVAIAGYCWGGSVSWLAATTFDFACAVGYYGGQITEFIEREARCPIMLHFGEADAGIPMSDVEQIREAHPEVTVHTYEGAGHGFNCDLRGSWHAEAAGTARERTMAFLAEHLG